jgi:hypothetical protein
MTLSDRISSGDISREVVGALKTADAWLGRLGRHVGRCGIEPCTCGLTRVRAEVSVALLRMTDWKTNAPDGLEAAIREFKATLPGWWYSTGECQVSAYASCSPTRESRDIELIAKDRRFDDGFHADLPQPATIADALHDVMRQALEAKAAL